MKPNTITVTVHLANNGIIEVLKEVTPSQAIEEYLFPACNHTVKFLSITATDEHGKLTSIIVGNSTKGNLDGVVSISD